MKKIFGSLFQLYMIGIAYIVIFCSLMYISTTYHYTWLLPLGGVVLGFGGCTLIDKIIDRPGMTVILNTCFGLAAGLAAYCFFVL